MLVLPVCFIALMSCKSGGKSEVEGVDMSGLFPPPVSDFLPDNCRPVPDTGTADSIYSQDNGYGEEIEGSVKLYQGSQGSNWKVLSYFVLPDTCKDPLAVYNSTPTPGTVAIKVTDVINKKAREIPSWCDQRHDATDCIEEIDKLENQQQLTKEGEEFFKKNAGKWIAVQYYTKADRNSDPNLHDLYVLAARVTDVRNGSVPKTTDYSKYWSLDLNSTVVGFTFIRPKVEAQTTTPIIADEKSVEYVYQVQK